MLFFSFFFFSGVEGGCCWLTLTARGSWAFLIGSYLQLCESLNKHPVEEVTTMKDFGPKEEKLPGFMMAEKP